MSIEITPSPSATAARIDAPQAPRGVRIREVATFSADAGYRNATYVRLTTDAGLVGWAEFYAGGMVDLAPLIQRYGTVLIEHQIDPLAPGAVSAALNATTKVAAGGLHQNAIAAIENACIDLLGKALGVPASRLFSGPFRTELPLYWTHCGSYRVKNATFYEVPDGTTVVRTMADLKDVAAEARSAGFTAVKTNPITFRSGTPAMFSGGFRLGPGLLDRQLSPVTLAELHEQLSVMRDGLGPDIDLMLDVSFSQKPEGYVKLARALRDLDLRWLEIDSHDPSAVADVRRLGGVPIASGEALYGLSGYRPLFEERAVDTVLVDVMWNGFWQSHRVATLADAYQVNVSPHCPVGDLGLLMSAHFAASMPNFDILEYRYDEAPWTRDFLTTPPVIANGCLTLSETPGWGSDVNLDALAAHPPRP